MGSALQHVNLSANELTQHSAFGRALEELNIVVIDSSRTMQTILRSMLQPLRPKRLRIYDTAQDALREMMADPPSLILTDWTQAAGAGQRFLKVLRHRSMAPLCYVPVIVLMSNATRSAVEAAFRSGSQAVMVKPLSPKAMRRRIEWITQDSRPLRAAGECFVVDGVAEILDAQRAKERLPIAIADLSSLNIDGPAETADMIDRLIRGESGEIDLAEPASRTSVRRRSPEGSATLTRLMRRRAELTAAKAANESLKSDDKSKKKTGKQRTRWADLWSN